MMKNLKIILLVCFLGLTSFQAQARSAVAFFLVDGRYGFGMAANFPTQKQADQLAIKSCMERAKEAGLNAKNSCKVGARAKEAGYGAALCGDTDCYVVFGLASPQEAVDTAYAGCSNSTTGCPKTNIDYVHDVLGFESATPKTKTVARTDASCVPKSSSRQCRSSCQNGNCIVKYSNGCSIKVQVQPVFDSFNNQWSYPSPSC